MGECWGAGTATFMLLGDVCTRSCAFCAIKTGRPTAELDWEEPVRVADAARKMGLKHVVLTSINRDDRKDGGAPIFAATHTELRRVIHGVTIESLIPDFKGDWETLQIVLDTPPDVLSHNLETVPRLYRRIRPWLNTNDRLICCCVQKAGIRSKTGIMVGLGESRQQVTELTRLCGSSSGRTYY